MANQQPRPGTKKGMARKVVVTLSDSERLLRLSAISSQAASGGETHAVSLAKLDRKALVLGYQMIASGQDGQAAA